MEKPSLPVLAGASCEEDDSVCDEDDAVCDEDTTICDDEAFCEEDDDVFEDDDDVFETDNGSASVFAVLPHPVRLTRISDNKTTADALLLNRPASNVSYL